MSFLLKTARAPLAATRFTLPATAARFTTASRLAKSPVDSVKDAAKTVDRTVADAAVKGIDATGTSSGRSSMYRVY